MLTMLAKLKGGRESYDGTVRSKCITQLLLLGAIDSIQILKDASDLQPSTGEAASADIHRVLDLRAPVIVKVLNGMCIMDAQIFKKHIREFYPLITKLICCDQMDVRGALAIFSANNLPH
ncbi:hypothetical protein GUJ93_ZPchr0007g4793 [Zizania palustris]|uniref:Sec7/BIG1-like C-terminal domain-containing protein n=1 Tax=Zizania palustris TaxID=103762 RepID=A0A8J5T7U4_ZIZPA|nr:hypothetical protein GUJ93_ZPchr0007g4793 [Zizania palustris]